MKLLQEEQAALADFVFVLHLFSRQVYGMSGPVGTGTMFPPDVAEFIATIQNALTKAKEQNVEGQ